MLSMDDLGQSDRGIGHVLSSGVHWHLCEHWSMNLSTVWQNWYTFKSAQRFTMPAHIPMPIVPELGRIRWNSVSLMLGTTIDF